MQIQIGAIVGKAQRLCFRWRRGRCGGNGRYLCRDVSHERRTSVTVLRSSLEVLCDGVIQEPKEVAQYHDSMLSETIHLQRMIGDLLDNAIKFSPKNSTVNLSLCSTASTCVITVSDSGPGVPEEELPYVFDRFYTSSGAANPQGTGLGLFIANQISQRHNADIRMENRCESGCRITVVFWKSPPGNNTM